VGPLLGGLVQRVFGGDATAAVQQLLAASDVQPDTIKRLRGVIAEAEKRANSNPQDASEGDGR
jgi:predicted transcriptional regulator